MTRYVLPALGVLCVIIILMYSVEAAFTVLGGIAAVLFGDNQRKRTEIEIKTDALKRQEDEAASVRSNLEWIKRHNETVEEQIVRDEESEVDQWLDS